MSHPASVCLTLCPIRLVYILVCMRQAPRTSTKTTIGSYEAKTQLPKLLRQVRAGRSFTITNRGEAIADLVPSARVSAVDKAAAVDRIKAFMNSDPVRGVNIRELLEEGRA